MLDKKIQDPFQDEKHDVGVQESSEETSAESETSEISPEDQTMGDLQQELAEMKERWVRSVAELENLRKRTQKELDDTRKYAAAQFARDLLSVSDNLARALGAMAPQEDLSDPVRALLDGVKLTAQELQSVFTRHGVKKVPALHEKFDPHVHQAMFEVEDAQVPAGDVAQVLQEGYVMHERLLRPAMVGVSKEKELSDVVDVSV